MRPTDWERSSPNFCACLIGAVGLRPLWCGRRQAANSFPAIPTAADQALLRWPRRSPDLMPCAFFFFVGTWDSVFLPPLPQDPPELCRRIVAAVSDIEHDMLKCVWAEVDYRLEACHLTKGGHIQHLRRMKKSIIEFLFSSVGRLMQPFPQFKCTDFIICLKE